MIQRTVVFNALVVECMAKLMGERHDIAKHAVEIRQDTALLQTFHTGTECAAGLAIPGIEVDPCFIEGSGHHVRQFLVEPSKETYQIIPGVLSGKLGRGFAHGGEQVVPRQTVLVTQCLSLCFQVCPEFGQILIHSTQHGIQGFLLHVGVLQCALQRRFVAPELAIGDGFQLDGVQSIGNRIFNTVIASQLCLISVLTNCGIAVIGQIPDRRQVRGISPVGNGHSAGQVLLHLTPCIPTGQTHFGHNGFAYTRKKVLAGFFQILEQEGIILQIRIFCNQLLQIFHLSDPVLPCGKGYSYAAVQLHDLSHLGACLRITGIGRLTQGCIACQLADQFRKLFLEGDTLFQAFHAIHTGKISRKLLNFFCKAGKCRHIRLIGRIRKALINGVQIPYFVHR